MRALVASDKRVRNITPGSLDVRGLGAVYSCVKKWKSHLLNLLTMIYFHQYNEL